VGHTIGLLRRSPNPAPRYSYEEHKIRRQLSHEVATLEAELDEREAALEKSERALMRRIDELEQNERSLAKRVRTQELHEEGFNTIARAMKKAIQERQSQLERELDVARHANLLSMAAKIKSDAILAAVADWMADEIESGGMKPSEARQMSDSLKHKIQKATKGAI
jgi:hypothetical protein